MTDQRTNLRRSKRRTALAVYATSAALFAIVGGSLSLRMAQGHDPSLGSLGAHVTQSGNAQHHKAGWTKKALRTTSSGRVIQVSQPGSPAAGGGGAPVTHSTHHETEGHDA